MKAYALVQHYFDGCQNFEEELLYFLDEDMANYVCLQHEEMDVEYDYWVIPIIISEETL